MLPLFLTVNIFNLTPSTGRKDVSAERWEVIMVVIAVERCESHWQEGTGLLVVSKRQPGSLAAIMSYLTLSNVVLTRILIKKKNPRL